MGRINILEKSVYTRIAAGEVVERPASVVKELIENAVDANAKHVEISIYNGGKDLIQVSDDGCGIDKDDLIKAVLPHATSKIKNERDLDMIMTLGFRGEALASIASVSVLTIISKTAEADSGYMVVAKDDTVSTPRPAPCETGTMISVERLFSNVPAREKFLKSSATEESEVTTLVRRLVFANSNVAFTYNVDGKTLIKTDGTGIESSFLELFSYNDYVNCFKIDEVKNGMRIFGYMGKPSYTKSNKTYQTVIINSRYVVNQTVSSAIYSAYAPFMMKHQFPFYQIQLDIAPQFLDVNVHPNKIEVRFMDNQTVYGTIYSVVRSALNSFRDASPLPNIEEPYSEKDAPVYVEEPKDEPTNEKKSSKKIDPNDPYSDRDMEKTAFYINGKVNDKRHEDISKYLSDAYSEYYPERATLSPEQSVFGSSEFSKSINDDFERIYSPEIIDFSVVGQVLKTYIILERGEEIIFIDQHAAHERLLYDKLKANLTDGKPETQGMIEPFVFKVNDEEIQFLTEKLIPMRRFGFDICDYDDDEFAIYGVPAIIGSMNLREFVDEMLSDTAMRTDIPDVFDEKIATMACKAAIKSGKDLSQSEINSLLKQIDGNFALKCPHGRPIAVKVTRKQIDKWFKRIL